LFTVIDMWRDSKEKRSSYDFLVMSYNLEFISKRLNESNIKPTLMIADVQKLINEENPLIASFTEEDRLRAGEKTEYIRIPCHES